MGFYGNITNVNKTQFAFDRTYPNRKTMEARLATDEIYLGRYVLIEYDTDGAHTLDTYLKCYVKEGSLGEEFYTSPTFEAKTRVRWSATNAEGKPSVEGTVMTDELIYVEKDLTPEDKNTALSQVFYKCINGKNSRDGDIAQFKLVSASESNYTKNYNIDTSTYGEGRGYDSTVWQKVYSQGTEKYVMIAELNSVVPTFDLSADAPTMNPITPHFDADSTNVYYKLHWQPQWGFRVAEANGGNSDVQATWETASYDPLTDKISLTENTVDAAINFNGPAFDPQLKKATINKHDDGDNYITILPTGKSGQEYNTHNGTGNKQAAEDIQEMRINLPAIGNMMSDAWDIIHGPNRDDARTDANGSLQGRLNSFKDIGGNQIPVKRSNDGTLVGTNINGNTSRTVTDITEESLHIDDKTQDDAWIKTVIDTSGLTDAKNSNNNGISIHHTFTSTPDTTSASNKNTDGVASDKASDKIELYTPYVDAAGHVVGKNVETVTLPYGFKTIKTNGRGTSTDINTGDDVIKTDVVADNTQDSLAINSGNKWIRIDTDVNNDSLTIAHDIHSIDIVDAEDTDLNDGTTDTITIQDISHDGAGHITANKDHTYTLPYGYKTIVPGEKSEGLAEIESNTESIVADNTQDSLTIAPGNKWIRVAGDEDNDTLTIAHEVHTITKTDISDSDLDGVGEFTVQDLQFDAAGHVIANQKHKYILPHAIRNIDVAGSDAISAGTTAAGKVEADSYNDTLTLNAQNRWINLKAEGNTISVGHASAGNETTTAGDEAASTPNFGATFNVPYIKYDEMGHIASSNTRTVKIPQGKLTDIASTKDNIANVLTSIDFTPSTGEIVTTHKNVSTLLLTGHTDTAEGHVSADESISEAFSKVDDRLDTEHKRADTEEKAINKRIDDLDVSDTGSGADVVSAVSQTDGKISVSHTNVGALKLTGYELPTAVSSNAISTDENLNTALGKLEFRINQEKNRIDDLDYSDESITQVISKITQTDGKIAVTRANAGTLLLTGYVKAESEAEVQAADSINTAFGKIAKNLDVKTAALSKELTDTIAGLDVDKIEAGEGEVLASVSEADGKISATSKSLGGIKITDYAPNPDTTDIAETDTLNAALGKLQAQINANESAITELTNGVSEEGINSVKELVAWTEEHGNTTQGIIETIGKPAKGEATSTGLYELIDIETAARSQADIDTNKRIDDLVKVTEEEKTKWSAAEANVQSDWNETDNTKDSFILNKPTNLVTEETTFVYSEAQVDDEGNEIPETEIRVTIQGLLTMVKDLTVALQNANNRIAELEKYHSTNENGGTEAPPVDNEGGEETPTDPETPTT